MKKLISFLMIFVLCFCFCACEDDETKSEPSSTQVSDAQSEEHVKTPEEVTEEFMRAMYEGDLDGLFALIPEFTYDVFIAAENLEVAEGTSKADAVYNYLKSTMEEEPEPKATVDNFESKISDTLTKETYLNSVKGFYISEGVISEKDLEKIEDVVFVAFNCDVKYENGETYSHTGFESALPCVKVDGKWYAEFLYLVFVPVRAETEIAKAEIAS